MKYIDSNKLIAEIERRKEKWLAESRLIKKGKDKAMYAAGKSSGYTEFLSIIDSLQQEQPERICSRCRHFDKKEDCCNCPYGGMKYSINENGVYKCNSFDEVDQDQPEIDLEKEIEKYFYDNFAFISSAHTPTKDIVSDIANHFYELGLNARK